jgi:uncharacterized protein (TIGR03085 family)
MPRHALDERIELVDTLRITDPDATTLCDGWSAAHLVAHLVLRERSVSELVGRLPSERARGLARRTVEDTLRSRSYSELIDDFAAGPPPWSPFAFPPVREAVNLLEYVVHHEDVRRGAPGWVPRVLPPERLRAVWSRLRVGARLTMRAAPVPVRLVWPEHGSVSVGRGEAAVTVTGAPVELALVAFGRQSASRAEFTGPDDAVARVRSAELRV